MDHILRRPFAVLDPATGDKLADVPDLNADDARRAIDAAHQAFPAWAAKPAKDRSAILRRWFELILAETEVLGAADDGRAGQAALSKPAAKSSMVRRSSNGSPKRESAPMGTRSRRPVASRRYVTIKQPIGVVAAITPWNFPIAMITRKVSSALAAGCTIVVKPSEETPLCALAVAKLAVDAGVPAGVFNVITTLMEPHRSDKC